MLFGVFVCAESTSIISSVVAFSSRSPANLELEIGYKIIKCDMCVRDYLCAYVCDQCCLHTYSPT